MYSKKFPIVPHYLPPPKKEHPQNQIVTVWCLSFQRFFFNVFTKLLVCLQLAIFNLIVNFGFISMSVRKTI